MDRLIPPDDAPGAWEAGVGDYLARQFTGDLRDSVDLYRLGLPALEAEALASAGAPLAALPVEAQDALLRRVEAADVRGAWPIDPAMFFQTVLTHVAEGYYSDPGNGGNRDSVAWRLIGFRPSEHAENQP